MEYDLIVVVRQAAREYGFDRAKAGIRDGCFELDVWLKERGFHAREPFETSPSQGARAALACVIGAAQKAGCLPKSN
jgi:hypothetical protein